MKVKTDERRTIFIFENDDERIRVGNQILVGGNIIGWMQGVDREERERELDELEKTPYHEI